MKLYSFKETTLMVNGVEITGWAEGDDTIIARRLEDSGQHVIGNDGTMIVSITADRSGEFVFNLMQTSESNLYLNTLQALGENGAFVPVFVQFKDNLGNDLYVGTAGYIPRPADATRGNTAQPQEWSVVVEKLLMSHGGSNPVT